MLCIIFEAELLSCSSLTQEVGKTSPLVVFFQRNEGKPSYLKVEIFLLYEESFLVPLLLFSRPYTFLHWSPVSSLFPRAYRAGDEEVESEVVPADPVSA